MADPFVMAWQMLVLISVINDVWSLKMLRKFNSDDKFGEMPFYGRGDHAFRGLFTPEAGAVSSRFSQQLDLEAIRSELKNIAALIGPGVAYEMLAEQTIEAENLWILELPMNQVIELIPKSYFPSFYDEFSGDRWSVVLIEDLYTQADAGKIETTVSRIVADLPLYFQLAIPPHALRRARGYSV